MPKRFLAFDFGTQKIGVAVGQQLTCTATPLDELPARDGVPDWTKVAELVKQWQPDGFIVGIPLNMDGSEGEIARRARKFGKRLHGRFYIPSYEMDERLSTRAARAELAEQSNAATASLGKASPGKVSLDSMAAKLILESWFRQQPGAIEPAQHPTQDQPRD